jgi:hypothetical protein
MTITLTTSTSTAGDDMSSLPVLADPVSGNLMIPDDTGELVAIHEASDNVLLRAVARLSELDAEIMAAKRALAFEARERYGVGSCHEGGHDFKVSEATSWPQRPTDGALKTLLLKGKISQADYDRAMPSKPKPDGTQLKALLGRLLSDPEAAKILADARTTSAPSIREIKSVAVEGSTA